MGATDKAATDKAATDKLGTGEPGPGGASAERSRSTRGARWDVAAGLMAEATAFAPGTVWLVGAGPGDPDMLTLGAVRALGQADVVVYDALVDERVLGLIRREARRVYAGKRGGKPSVAQTAITETLVREAAAGRRVVRLKGGDPFIFGRGGEEAEALAAAGVPFRVVPGVTSALAGLAEAAIPATMRGANRALVLATGHSLQPGHSAIDWEALAQLNQPVLLYMAMRYLPEICARLIAGGMAPETPAALIASVSLPDARMLITRLDRLGEESRAFEAPAIAVIGWIVEERKRLLPGAHADAGVAAEAQARDAG